MTDPKASYRRREMRLLSALAAERTRADQAERAAAELRDRLCRATEIAREIEAAAENAPVVGRERFERTHQQGVRQ